MARARPWSGAWIEGSPHIPDKEGAGWAFRVWDDRFFHRGGPHAVSRGSTRGLFFVDIRRAGARPIVERPPQCDAMLG